MVSSISSAIINHNKSLKELFQKYKDASDDAAKEYFSNELRWEVARSNIAEELVIHPCYLKHFGDEGKNMVQRDRVQHEEARGTLNELQIIKISDPNFCPTFCRLVEEIAEQTNLKEKNELPKLDSVLSSEESDQLLADYRAAKEKVPTKPPKATAHDHKTPLEKIKNVFRISAA